jgi:hypothetical protein
LTNPQPLWLMTSLVQMQLEDGYGSLTKTVTTPESRLDDSARFWTAAVFLTGNTNRRRQRTGALQSWRKFIALENRNRHTRSRFFKTSTVERDLLSV